MPSQIIRAAPTHLARHLSNNAALTRRAPQRRSLKSQPQRKQESCFSRCALEEADAFSNESSMEEEEVEQVEFTEEERRIIEMDDLSSPSEEEDASEEGGLWEDERLRDQELDPEYPDREPFLDREALERAFEFGKAMGVVADEMKCQSIRLLDVHRKVDWTDVFLIVTAMSRTQLRAVLGKMEKVAQDDFGIEVLEAVTRRSEWESVDFGDVVVHVFSPRTRSYYKLDEKYEKCEEIDVPRIPSPGSGSPQWQRTLKSA